MPLRESSSSMNRTRARSSPQGVPTDLSKVFRDKENVRADPNSQLTHKDGIVKAEVVAVPLTV